MDLSENLKAFILLGKLKVCGIHFCEWQAI